MNRRTLERAHHLVQKMEQVEDSTGGRSQPGAYAMLLKLLESIEVDLLIDPGAWKTYYEAMNTLSLWASYGVDNGITFARASLQTVLAGALARETPVRESRFPAIRDAALRSVLERDYGEALQCIESGAWKAAVVLLGSVLEAALYDRLRSDVAWTMRQSGVPGKPKGLGPRNIASDETEDQWALRDLIAFCAMNDVIPQGSDSALSYFVRTPRNSIHPCASLRKSQVIGAEDARAARAAVDHALTELARRPFPPP